MEDKLMTRLKKMAETGSPALKYLLSEILDPSSCMSATSLYYYSYGRPVDTRMYNNPGLRAYKEQNPNYEIDDLLPFVKVELLGVLEGDEAKIIRAISHDWQCFQTFPRGTFSQPLHINALRVLCQELNID
jgi:hypothetical protein